MSDARRRTVASVVTVLMHGSLFLGAFTFVPAPLDVDIDIEFDMMEVDLIDPDAIQGTDVNAEPPEPEPEPAAPEEEPDKDEPEPAEPEPVEVPPDPPVEEPVVDEGPKRDLGQKTSRVNKLGPPSANYHILISTRNVRKLPFGQSAMDMIGPLPDFEYLVKKGGFDPLQDFDHVLIASSNLRSLTQTFLAVDYRISREEVKTKIETAVRNSEQTIEWKDSGGILSGNPVPADGSADDDPRHFVLLEEKIAVLVRPEFLPAILQEEVGDEKTAANFVAELTKLRRYASRIPTAGVQAVAHDLHAALKRKSAGAFELPNDLEFTVEARKAPEFNIRLQFVGAAGAQAFVGWWNGQFRDFIDGNLTAKIMLGGLIDDIEVEQKGREVTVWGELEQAQVELILTTVGSMVEKEQARVRERAAERRAAAEREQPEAGEPPPPSP